MDDEGVLFPEKRVFLENDTGVHALWKIPESQAHRFA